MAGRTPLRVDFLDDDSLDAEGPGPGDRPRTALLDLSTLALSLLGFLGLIAALIALKGGATRVPRTLFVLFLALACAPFFQAFWRVPKPPYLIAPVIALTLLYPIAAPHGIVYGRDPIFNYAFTERVASSGFWDPGTVSGLAETYSLYPLGNTYMAFILRTASLPAEVGFLWIEPVLRLLALPAAVYAIGQRIFGTRVASLGLFLYLGTASILINLPVQQGMGTIFFALSLLSLLILNAAHTKVALQHARLLFATVAGGIVMTHHLSSYLFAAWLVGLVAVLISDVARPRAIPFRISPLAGYFVVLVLVYALTVSYRVFTVHQGSFEIVVARILTPESLPATTRPGLGRSFALFEIVWIAASIFGLLGLALASVRLYRNSRRHRLAVANAFVAGLFVIGTLPLLATGTEFVPLRVGEYANLFLAPFAAATLIRWTRTDVRRGTRLLAWTEPMPASTRTAAMIVVASLLFMGGNLVVQTMRPYFDDVSQWNTDTPLLFGADDVRLGMWSRTHYGNRVIWGDHAAIDIFAGFGGMEVLFGGSHVFANATFDDTVWAMLCVSDYFAISTRMLKYPSQWYLEAEPRVRAPITEAELEKFALDPHFSLVFQDDTFSVYRLMSKPEGTVDPDRCPTAT